MLSNGRVYLAGLVSLFFLSGCVVRTYSVTKERLDQDLSGGNHGYLMGKAEYDEGAESRKTERTTRILELEMKPVVKLWPWGGKKKKPAPAPIKTQIAESRVSGYQNYTEKKYYSEEEELVNAELSYKEYVVEKGDTLQKISQKFYGTTKNWKNIYEANSDKLKGPDQIRPGQVLNIPE